MQAKGAAWSAAWIPRSQSSEPRRVGCGKALTGGDSCGMKRIKKPLRWGCEGWRLIACVMPKSNGKQAPPLSFAVTPTVARYARPSPPSPWRKKSRFAKKKVGSAEKKTRLPLTVAHRMYQGRYIPTGWFYAAPKPFLHCGPHCCHPLVLVSHKNKALNCYLINDNSRYY